MKGFRFRLDPILRLRSGELDARRAELQRESGLREEAAADADACEERAQALSDELHARLAAGVDADDARAAAAARRRLEAESQRAREDVATLAEREEVARRELTEAWRRLRALEILRTRVANDWRREAERRDQRIADDRAAARRGERTR